MAVPATVDEFIDLVRKSGVADEKRLDAYVQRARAGMPPEPTKVAGLFVQDGIITSFQAENILAGKWRRFSIGKYKVLERLGSGGFAQVYLCEHKLMRRRVAVKVLPVAKAKNSSALDRFYREARAAAALDHPNIVHAYDIDQDNDLHFIVMEYVDGANLQEIVKRSGPLSVERACHYIQQAALALQIAHEHSLVHRDIKPGNILVDRTGLVKILDMGLALIFNDEEELLTKKFEDGTLGTADYLSPEQAIDSHAVDIRTDIYSLGMTFYFLLAGKAPFEGVPLTQKLMAHQMKAPPPIEGFRKDVPAALVAVMDKMMAKNADERYATPGDVFDALAPFTQTEIAPPTDAEIPYLSPAAIGVPAANEASDARQNTPRPQPASSKKSPAPVVVPRTPPSATVKAAPAADAPAAVMVAPVETPELAPWEQAAHDTDNPAAKDDTASQSDLKLPRGKKPPTISTKNQIIVGALVMAFVVIPIVLTIVIFGALWIFFPEKPVAGPETPPILAVSRDSNRKGYQRIQQALDNAKVGSTIVLWDDTYDESVVIRKGTAAGITLQAAPGKEIVWRSGRGDPTQQILWISHSEDFKLNGKGIVFDGAIDKQPDVNNLIMITGENPGLLVEDLQFKNFALSAVLIMNAAGKPDHPIQLHRLSTTTKGDEKLRGAIYFDANPDVKTLAINDHIEIADLKTLGIEPANAIRYRDAKILGPNVSFPGR
jgi:eukaryotic-like serine/threonine-protein kinase